MHAPTMSLFALRFANVLKSKFETQKLTEGILVLSELFAL